MVNVNVKFKKMSFKEEQNGKFFMGANNIYVPENTLQNTIDKLKEDKDKEEMLTKLRELDDIKQKEIEDNISELELLPEGNKVIILPYPTNPYKKIKQGQIYLGNNGSFKNPDSGEMDTLQELVVCGKIIEVGRACKEARVGDDIFYIKNSALPLPFMSQGYVVIAEPNAVCYIGKGLK